MTTTRSAPPSSMAAVFSPCVVWPHTTAPAAWASWTAIDPTPPLAPRTSTRSSARSPARECSAFQAVTPATPMPAAWARSVPSGSSITAPDGTTACSWYSPWRTTPTPPPDTSTGRPSTWPVPSVPGTQGRLAAAVPGAPRVIQMSSGFTAA